MQKQLLLLQELMTRGERDRLSREGTGAFCLNPVRQHLGWAPKYDFEELLYRTQRGGLEVAAIWPNGHQGTY